MGKFMISIIDKLYIGSETDCLNKNNKWAIIHACKYPCYENKLLEIQPHNSNYLKIEEPNNLYLNIIDPPYPLFKLETFQIFLGFTTMHWNNNQTILIHCNQGFSRAPSLALVFLAKYLKYIDNSSYDVAKHEFLKLFPQYKPNTGIKNYLRVHWHEIKQIQVLYKFTVLGASSIRFPP